MFARGFLGVVPASLIETIAEICRPQEWQAVYVACSGTFRTERGLLSKFPKIEVRSNDVSLLSTALGAAAGNNAIPLQFQWKGELAWIEELGLTHPADRIASILLALTYSSFAKGRPNRFKTEHLAHLRGGFREHVAGVRKMVDRLLAAMPIASYFAGDFRDHIETAIERGAGVIAYPPTFRGGYERLFEYLHANVEWQEPNYRIFDPETDVQPVLDRLHSSGIPYFLYLDQEVPGFSPQVRMKARGKRDIFGYGRAAGSGWRAPRSQAKPFAYDPIRIEALTEQSVLRTVPAPEAQISFLREAFLKRGIAFGTGDYGVLVFLDEMLVGAISYRKPIAASDKTLFVLTDLVIVREGRLAKMIARLATCHEVFRPLEHRQLTRYQRLSTTVFSDHPVSMKYRGAWELHSRDEINDRSGRFKLVYHQATREEGLDACYAWWWQRDGQREVAAARRRMEAAGSAHDQAR